MRYVIILALLLPQLGLADMDIDPEVLKALVKAADNNNISVKLLTALCFKESGLRPKAIRYNDGDGHSYGLCQIKVATAKHFGFKGKHGTLFSPIVNAEFAARYLRYQLDRYEGNWVDAVSAYNAGHAIPGNKKSRRYVSDILKLATELELDVEAYEGAN